MKYSYEMKLKAVLLIKNGILMPEPYNRVYRHWIDRIREWEKIYDIHGENGLKHKYRWHSAKEKIQAINEVLNGKSIRAVSIEYRIPAKSITDWFKIYRQKGMIGLTYTNSVRRPIMPKKKKANNLNDKITKSKFTDEEIEYILAENAYLKKLQALVQEKNLKQQKK